MVYIKLADQEHHGEAQIVGMGGMDIVDIASHAGGLISLGRIIIKKGLCIAFLVGVSLRELSAMAHARSQR